MLCSLRIVRHEKGNVPTVTVLSRHMSTDAGADYLKQIRGKHELRMVRLPEDIAARVEGSEFELSEEDGARAMMLPVLWSWKQQKGLDGEVLGLLIRRRAKQLDKRSEELSEHLNETNKGSESTDWVQHRLNGWVEALHELATDVEYLPPGFDFSELGVSILVEVDQIFKEDNP